MTESTPLPTAPQAHARHRPTRVFARHYRLFFGATTILVLLLFSIVLPLPFDPLEPNASSVLQAPSMAHWFGTDSVGFDVFSRTIDAAHRDLSLALGGALAAALIGVPIGLLAISKGMSSQMVMRLLDAFQAFPLLVLAIAVVTLAGNRLEMVLLAIVIIEVPRFIRLVRAEGLALRESRYVEAAIAMGASRLRVLFVHMLPNLTGVILVQLSIAAASALVVIAALSFLGIGVSPPSASWGAMIQAGARQLTTGYWWASAFPGLFVFISVMSLNLIADDLDRLFERSQR